MGGREMAAQDGRAIRSFLRQAERRAEGRNPMIELGMSKSHKKPNQTDAPNPTITLQFHAGRQRRGVGDPRR